MNTQYKVFPQHTFVALALKRLDAQQAFDIIFDKVSLALLLGQDLAGLQDAIERCRHAPHTSNLNYIETKWFGDSLSGGFGRTMPQRMAAWAKVFAVLLDPS